MTPTPSAQATAGARVAKAGSRAPRRDRRAARRDATKGEIVAAAWELVRIEGLAGLNLRDLGERVGMKAQSLYSYFDSKADIYDAMFREGYLSFLEQINATVHTVLPADAGSVEGAEGVAVLRRAAELFFEFCTTDPVRYQLLFQRTIPDFVPSDESYAVALEVYRGLEEVMAKVGITDPAALDLWTALHTGMADQQISNDPGGDRWARLLDQAVDMYVAAHAPHLLIDSDTPDDPGTPDERT